MEINKNSWHYQAVSFAFKNIPKSLCTYFWATIFSLFVVALVFTLACIIVVGAVYITVIPFIMLLGVLPYNVVWVEMSIVTSFTCYLLLGVSLASSYWNDTLKPKLHRASKPIKRESLVGAYVRAKKQKICPTLEFVE